MLRLEYEPPLRPTTVILLPERGDLTVRSTSREHDSVDAFAREARIAADVLALYKAAKDPNAQSERKWPAEHGPPEDIRNREVIERMNVYEIYRPESGDEGSPRFWTEWGLAVCADITQAYVSEYCRPHDVPPRRSFRARVRIRQPARRVVVTDVLDAYRDRRGSLPQ